MTKPKRGKKFNAESSPMSCPHLHFKGDTVKRKKLTREQHMNLLSLPKGYRWPDKEKKEKEGETKKSGGGGKPKNKKSPSSKREKVIRRTYINNFLAEMWTLLTPNMLDKLKDMLKNEFGMSDEEADKFIKEQRERHVKLSSTVETYSYGSEKRYRLRENINDCHKYPKNVLGPRHSYIKEFADMMSNKLMTYFIEMMTAERTPRQKRIFEKLLEIIGKATGEDLDPENPFNDMQKAFIIVADRASIWIDKLLGPQKPKPVEVAEEEEEEEDEYKEEEEEEEEGAVPIEGGDQQPETEEGAESKPGEGGEGGEGQAEGEEKKDETAPGEGEDTSKEKEEGQTEEGEAQPAGEGETKDAEGDAEKKEEEEVKKAEEGAEPKEGDGQDKPVEEDKAKAEEDKKEEEQAAGKEEEKPLEAGATDGQAQAEEPGKGAEEAGQAQAEEPGKGAEEPGKGAEEAGQAQAEEPGKGEEEAGQAQAEEPGKGEEEAGPVTGDEAGAEPDQGLEGEPAPGDQLESGQEGEGEGGPEGVEGGEGGPEGVEDEEGEEGVPGDEGAGEEPEGEKKAEPGKEDEKEPAPEKVGDEGVKEIISDIGQLIDDVEERETPRKQAIEDMVNKKLADKAGDGEPDQEKIAAQKKMAHKIGSWMDKVVEDVELEYGVADQLLFPISQRGKGEVFSVEPNDGNYNIRRIEQPEIKKKVMAVRNLNAKDKPTAKKGPDTTKPMVPDDVKEWAKWASDVVSVAEDWSAWIDKTVTDANKKIPTKKDDEQDWKRFQDTTQDRALQLRKNKKEIKEIGEMWKQKANK